MSRSRAVVVGVLVTLAVLLQAGLVARLPLPGGEPQLLVLLVAAVAWTDGATAGMVTGFAGGLLADLAPPSLTPLGRSALVLVVVAEVVGLLRRRPTGVGWPLFAVGLATVLAGLGGAAVDAVLQRPQLPMGQLLLAVLVSAAYTVALAPFVLPLVGFRRRARSGSRPVLSRTHSAGPGVRRRPLDRAAAPGGLR